MEIIRPELTQEYPLPAQLSNRNIVKGGQQWLGSTIKRYEYPAGQSHTATNKVDYFHANTDPQGVVFRIFRNNLYTALRDAGTYTPSEKFWLGDPERVPHPPIFDPFHYPLQPMPRLIPTGKSHGDRLPAPPNVGLENENRLRIFAEKHAPAGQHYVHFARTEQKGQGCDGAWVDDITNEIMTKIEFKSYRRYELTKREFAAAMDCLLRSKRYIIVMPQGIEDFDPRCFIPNGTMRNVGLTLAAQEAL
jgi:hypothetical protein